MRSARYARRAARKAKSRPCLGCAHKSDPVCSSSPFPTPSATSLAPRLHRRSAVLLPAPLVVPPLILPAFWHGGTGEYACKYVYDSARQRLHRITDTGLVGKLKKELLAMINPATHAVSSDTTAMDQGAAGASAVAGGKGPAMSDSDSDGQTSDDEEEEEEEERESAEHGAESREGGGKGVKGGVKAAGKCAMDGVEGGAGWKGDLGGIPVVSGSSGGYLSALEFEKASKPSTLSWSSMKLASEVCVCLWLSVCLPRARARSLSVCARPLSVCASLAPVLPPPSICLASFLGPS